jgi:FMN-dependent NADH-azoreductase
MEVAMSTLLYIKASPMGDLSYSTAVGDAFVEAYLEANPGHEVQTIDIWEKSLPDFDFAAASAKYKIMHGKDHSQEDRRTWQQIVDIIQEFKYADKYVIATPMWNFSIPYRLKQYIDILVQPGYTFTVGPDGNYEGLFKDKPVFVVYARGGTYPPGSPKEAFDLQKRYLELILSFMGFGDIRSIVVEPTLAGGPDAAEKMKAEAIEKARQTAGGF